MKKYYYVYVTMNLENGKKYVGDHSTNNLNDGYLGSGRAILGAVKKYGKTNFEKEILEYFNSREEAFKAQEKWICKFNSMVPNGYNINKKGGYSGKDVSEQIKDTKFNKTFSRENVKKLVNIYKNTTYSPDLDPIVTIKRF